MQFVAKGRNHEHSLDMELRKSLRRKGAANIRSPAVRRNSSAEVIMKGWLYKLEGSTIKQWKKRWFILSEYCLFYYKGPDEEKCLGSILLPSYKIRPCTGEDKVSHKHAFVAEHQNTKSYYFAAENSTSMCQWMNAMCLASLMQREPQQGVEQCPQPQHENFPPSYEGIHPFRPHPAQYHHHHPPQPHPSAHYQPNEPPYDANDYNAAENDFLLSGEQYPCSYTQSPIYDSRPNKGPVYANAPPKPRRHGTASPTSDPYGFEPPMGAEARIPHSPAHPYGASDLPVGAADPRCHYGDPLGKGPLFRPRSADFLERSDNGRESRMRRVSQGKPRPKSSMAHYDWQGEDEDDEDVWAGYVEGREEGQRRASSDSRPTPADGGGRVAGARTALAQSSLGSSLGSVQSKKTPHKEESMKRLLEWKQRMLQSPLRKKHQGQGAIPPDMYSSMAKRPVSSLGLGSSHPPERPPLPREYQMKLLKDAETQESRVAVLQQQNLNTPLPDRQDLRAPPGPDLIQHAKISPTKPSATESPDYVNLRNLHYPPSNSRRGHDFQETVFANHTPSFQQPDRPYCISPHQPPASTVQYVPRNSRQYEDHATDNSAQRATYQNVMRPRSAPYYKDSDGFPDVPPIQSSTPTEAAQARTRCFSPGVEGNSERWQQKADPVYASQRQAGTQCYPGPVPLVNKGKPKQTESKSQYSRYMQEADMAYSTKAPTGDAAGQQGLSRDNLHAQRVKVTRQSLSRTESDRSCSDSKPTYLADEGTSPVINSPSLRKDVDSPSETSSDVFAIQKEDYYRASQLFYSKQPLSKGLLATVSDTSAESYQVETFDSRYRRNCNTPKSPEWELDKDIGLPVPDNLDLSFQSTSNNSVFEAPCETPGDQSPEFFQGTLRPSRTYVRDRQSSKEDTLNGGASNGTRVNVATSKQKPLTEVCFEEMRSTIQKKKEAPPPNIVQDRIKCFEPKEGSNVAESPKEAVEGKKCPGDSDNPTPEPEESEDSDSSCDVATLKSMHESQSHSTSVLSDLRKTADTKKDDVSHIPSLDVVPTAPKVPTGTSSNALHVPKSSEAHYVPMGGWLAKDADYVTMSIDSSADSKASEPVYNEPMVPVPSFVHDAFSKLSSATRQKSKDISGSSSDCSTENIYERVRQGSLAETSPKTALALSADRESSAKVEEVPVYEEPYALVNASAGNGVLGNADARFGIFGTENHTTKLPTKKPFPDLLHHEEVKDSGASDADDEASRADFDTAPSSLPSYQKEVLSEHLLSSGEALSQPLGLISQQSYSPVYATQTTKYTLHRERLQKQETVLGMTGGKEVNTVPSRLTDGAVPTQSSVSPAKASKMGVNLHSKKPEMPTSIGLLRTMECDTSSSDPGSLLCGPKGASKVPEGSARPRGTPETLSQVSSPLLSTAPDVLPSEVRTVVSECNSKKSPNCAPYYYSDIFGEKLGQGANVRQPGQHMRITPNMLNNIREMRMNSPTPRGDVGRRVNDISISAPNGLNTSHIRTRSEPEPMTAEFENTIRGLLNPSDTRKFSDAEKNKYIAGHTLEKTSHMAHSVLSGMRKQRCDDRKLDDTSQPSNMLPRRLSRSLEDVIDVQGSTPRSKTPLVGASDAYDEPYYENVGFASASKPQAPRCSAGPQASAAKHSVYDGEDLCGEIAVGSIVKNLFGNSVDFLGVPPTSSSVTNLYGGLGHLQQRSDVTAISSGLAAVDLGQSDRDANAGLHATSGIQKALNSFTKEQDHGIHNYSNDSLHSYSSECQLDAHNVFETEMSSSSPSTGLSHSFSAGDLLGKSHEELVLLLIQLRRNHNNLTTAKVRCEMELRTLKENIVHSDSKHSATDVQRLVSVQRKLNELNKNLQLTQPLINLVENMVKLGSLYNIASSANLAEVQDSGYANNGGNSIGRETAEIQRATIEKEIETIRNMLAGGITPGGPSKEDLEVELRRLQTLVDELLHRKRGLNFPPIADDTGKPSKPTQVNLSSTAASGRKKHERTYYETDLDSGITNDVATDVLTCHAAEASYVMDAASIIASPEPVCAAEELLYLTQDINEADDRTKKFYGILPRDRAQEIKTVRIVKRESERRQRGRDHRRKGPFEEGLVHGRQEALFYQDQAEQDPSSDDSTKQEAVFKDKAVTESHKKSEQSVTPSSSADSLSSGGRSPRRNRRNKRRHYTISGSLQFLDQHSPPKLPASLRSRDDMDMERCLRTVNTPDIVRSTIKKSDVYDEQTIDRQIGLPQKILIPERYIEVESENITAVERLRRSLKAANIRKMLTESVAYQDIGARDSVEGVRSKVGEEKRRRAHLLALNHSIAKEVMERSKMVAAHITPVENAQ
ncbi:uncharacterized protein LOC135394084 isoform X2 [Ornithodoros turicata]|uniref:uncharacterized protein LOC135394084 isoform X2 n=1 Tax=Ornithodoros turicata TaxID=34597 RepID=UPI00313988D2